MRWPRVSIVFSLFSVFCTPLALAQPLQCSSVLSSQYALEGRIEVKAEVLNRALNQNLGAEDFAKTITEIDSLLGPLEVPTESRIVVHTDFLKSGFNPLTAQVSVGTHPEAGTKIHPKINLTQLAHEYGHAIFELNLMKSSKSYKLFFQEGLEKKDQINANPKEFPTYHHKWNLRKAYHELFADTIVMLTTQDPHALMRAALDPTNSPQKHSPEHLSLRDFAAGRHHLNRQTWNKSQHIRVQIMGDYYFAFLPARWELWDITKNKLKSENYRRTLPAKVFSILERHLSQALAKTPEEFGTKRFKDIDVLNQQIIEDFRREL